MKKKFISKELFIINKDSHEWVTFQNTNSVSKVTMDSINEIVIHFFSNKQTRLKKKIIYIIPKFYLKLGMTNRMIHTNLRSYWVGFYWWCQHWSRDWCHLHIHSFGVKFPCFVQLRLPNSPPSGMVNLHHINPNKNYDMNKAFIVQ